LIALEDVKFMQGKEQADIKGLVLTIPTLARFVISMIFRTKETLRRMFFSFKTNEDVIKYVSENEGMVGVVGVNWLSQPTAFEKRYENINVLNVKVNIGYFAPSQNNIAEGTYPLQ
jgi:phosphate transport system substrate-binding protein